MASQTEVEAALADLAGSYRADGYDLIVESVAGPVVRVRIEPGHDACTDCLVPKEIAVQMIMATLEGVPAISSVDLVYPTDRAR